MIENENNIFINSASPQNNILENRPNVFTIEPNRSFLKSLAKTLDKELLKSEEDKLLWSDTIILLPTKRAARALAQEFMDVRDEQATILPRIRTLGDIDPDDMNLHELDFDNSPTISTMARKFILAQLIAKKNEVEGWRGDPVAALGGADALADLLESAELVAIGGNGIDWSKLDDLVKNKELAEHWQKSTEFLKIITAMWPQYLKDNGLIDPATKRRQSIEKLAQNWEINPPKHPVIIAGSTGAIPATRELMRVVSRLQKGAIILPGLDKQMGKAWDFIKNEEGHPQRILHDTIAHIGVVRDEVRNWPDDDITPDYLKARRIILNEALTPKDATADWLNRVNEIGKENIKKGLEGISLIKAESEDEEANAIAIEMRKTLEEDGKTCVLITPNQDITRRVCSKMAKWNIRLDNSSGMSISETSLGIYFELVMKILGDNSEPNALVALLNHPNTNFGMDKWELRLAASELEIEFLRCARRDYCLNDLLKRIEDEEAYNLAKHEDNKPKYEKSKNLVLNIIKTFEEIGDFTGNNVTDVAQYFLTACEAIAKSDDIEGDIIWKGQSGNAAASFFNDVFEHGHLYGAPNLEKGLEIIASLMVKIVVRPINAHPRLAILGPLEARLLRYDKYILAGLDEGVWPKPPDIDPFLSRPMRKELGLQARDLRISLSAHDFAQMAANPNVIITSCAKRGGSPAVLSRWLWRIITLTNGAMGKEEAKKELDKGAESLKLARQIAPKKDDKKYDVAPKPKPPIDARPNEFSATQIETWIRDPYKIYAQKILNLRELDPIGGEVSSKERGTAIHAAMERIINWQENPPKNPEAELMLYFREELEKAGFTGDDLEEEVENLKPSAALLAKNEIEKLKKGYHFYAEKWISTTLETQAGALKLKAKVDRIDVLNGKDEATEIWDFKTGLPPSDKEISILKAPQLPVTALILSQRPRTGFEYGKVTGFGHIKIGGKNPQIRPYEFGKAKRGGDTNLTQDEMIERTQNTLNYLYETYSDPNMPYLSKPRPKFVKRGNYEDMIDRLARRIEWANAESEGDDE